MSETDIASADLQSFWLERTRLEDEVRSNRQRAEKRLHDSLEEAEGQSDSLVVERQVFQMAEGDLGQRMEDLGV